MSKKTIIGFVGEMASGKGTASHYLENKHGAAYYRFSTILRSIAQKIYLEQTRKNMQKLSTVLRKNFGQDILAKSVAADVQNDKHKIIIVDGIRRLADIKYLLKISGFHLIHITASAENRYKRLVIRKENPGDDKKTFKQFLEDEKQESEREIKKTARKARYIIDNNGTKKDLYKNLDELMRKIQR